MTMYTDKDRKMLEGEGPHMTPPHSGPIPPHVRKGLLQVEFDEKDMKTLHSVFGDEDTASAAMEIIKNAPPEIQILAIQLVDIIQEVA